MHRARGFTLIEVMIVLAAAGVLATLGMLTSGKWFLAP
jgi:prepilin-type N-terminal cleavage/methylation domain-containing protein